MARSKETITLARNDRTSLSMKKDKRTTVPQVVAIVHRAVDAMSRSLLPKAARNGEMKRGRPGFQCAQSQRDLVEWSSTEPSMNLRLKPMISYASIIAFVGKTETKIPLARRPTPSTKRAHRRSIFDIRDLEASMYISTHERGYFPPAI
jgi:hypothetical protein